MDGGAKSKLEKDAGRKQEMWFKARDKESELGSVAWRSLS